MAARKEARKDPIQIAIIEVRKEHFKTIPGDWPQRFLLTVPAVVLRPVTQRAPKPVSVEILAPASVIQGLRKNLTDRFVLTVTSTG